ncbi:MAG TPA: hypothetical protein VKM54_27670 [Myxococcota bacterium]|nr:hypothetical protein [Myxococcota bacterium]
MVEDLPASLGHAYTMTGFCLCDLTIFLGDRRRSPDFAGWPHRKVIRFAVHGDQARVDRFEHRVVQLAKECDQPADPFDEGHARR